MSLFLVTSVYNDGMDASSFRVVDAATPLVVAQDMLDNPWAWESLLRNTGIWWDLTYSEYNYGEPLRWSAVELLAKIEETWIDGGSRNQVRIHEIAEIKQLQVSAQIRSDVSQSARRDLNLL